MVAEAPAPARDPPWFSVIIPWHGRWEHLHRAGESVARQIDRDYELLIVCNGEAAALAEQLQAREDLPPRRVLVSAPADANAARNVGSDAARGHWLALLDADDEFTPEKLAAMRGAIAAGAADIFLSRGRRVRSDKKAFVFPSLLLQPDDNISEYFFSRGCNCSTSSIVARRDVARSVRFAPGLPKFQDNDFLIRAQASGAKIGMLEEPLFLWHDASEAGRLSRGDDYERQMAWAKSLAPAFTEKAYRAFCARRVAQYVFPRDPIRNGRRFWDGWRKGGLSLPETGLLVARALLPASLARRGVDVYARVTQPAPARPLRDER